MPQRPTSSGPLPLIVDGHRPFVDLTLETPAGPQRAARFWIDTGGGGLVLTEVEIDGARSRFLLDTGASVSVISSAVMDRWRRRHADWPVEESLSGEAATLGGRGLATVTVPSATWGPHVVTGVGFVVRSAGVFENHLSKLTGQPVVGALAGNVLHQFRVELDCANEHLYLSR